MDLTPYRNCLALTNSVFVANEEKPYRPCCWFKTYIDATDIHDYRRQLAEIDLEESCDYCIQQDKGGEYSYRQHFNNPDEFIITASIDNICNLKCVTCTPNNSTQILAERLKYDDKFAPEEVRKFVSAVVAKQTPKKVSFIKDALSTSDFKDLRIDILGGEPLINPAVFDFIDWLAEQSYADRLALSITTNGTTYTDKLEKYINIFKRVNVQLSIDGTGEEFEYLRFGASFETLEKVCDSFYELTKKYENFNMGCHYTLSWMNCLRFSEFYNWMSSRYPNLTDLYVSKLQTPEPYSIELLSLEMRTKVYNEVMSKINRIESHGYDKGLFLYKEHMLTTAFDKFDSDLFHYGTGLLMVSDKKRGNNHIEIIRNLIEFLDLIEIDPSLNYINDTGIVDE